MRVFIRAPTSELTSIPKRPPLYLLFLYHITSLFLLQWQICRANLSNLTAANWWRLLFDQSHYTIHVWKWMWTGVDVGLQYVRRGLPVTLKSERFQNNSSIGIESQHSTCQACKNLLHVIVSSYLKGKKSVLNCQMRFKKIIDQLSKHWLKYRIFLT